MSDDTESLLQKWNNITITNYFMFTKVFRKENICKNFLSKLLNQNINKLDYINYEKVFDDSFFSKSIRLDIYVETQDQVFDVEMQTTFRKENPLPLRSRYYQCKIDNSLLEKGVKYSELRKSYIIFICTFDPFGKNRAQYIFKNICLTNHDLDHGDGRTIIYLNTKGRITDLSPDIASFLKYCKNQTVNSEFTRTINNAVNEIKADESAKKEFMSLEIEIENRCKIAEEKGIKIGEENAKRRLLQELKALNISTDKIKSLQFFNEQSDSNDTASHTKF